MINTKETKREFINELLTKEIYKVLDLGCGEMLLTKSFLKKGAYVKGIDIKDPSLIPEGAIFVKGNVLKEEFGNDFDLVTSSFLLHLFKREYALQLISKMKESTIDKGYNLLILFSDKDPLYNQERFFPSLNEILNIYAGWRKIKVLEEESEVEEHSGLSPHTHKMIFLILQKV